MSLGIGQEAFIAVNAQSRMRLVTNNHTISHGSRFFLDARCNIPKITYQLSIFCGQK